MWEAKPDGRPPVSPQRVETGLELAIALYHYHDIGNFPCDSELVRQGLDQLDPLDPRTAGLYARSLYTLAQLAAWEDIHLARAQRPSQRYYRQVIQMLRAQGDLEHLALALAWLAWMCQGEEEAYEMGKEGVAIARQLDDPWVLAEALWCHVSTTSGDQHACAQESYELFRQCGDPYMSN